MTAFPETEPRRREAAPPPSIDTDIRATDSQDRHRGAGWTCKLDTASLTPGPEASQLALRQRSSVTVTETHAALSLAERGRQCRENRPLPRNERPSGWRTATPTVSADAIAPGPDRLTRQTPVPGVRFAPTKLAARQQRPWVTRSLRTIDPAAGPALDNVHNTASHVHDKGPRGHLLNAV